MEHHGYGHTNRTVDDHRRDAEAAGHKFGSNADLGKIPLYVQFANMHYPWSKWPREVQRVAMAKNPTLAKALMQQDADRIAAEQKRDDPSALDKLRGLPPGWQDGKRPSPKEFDFLPRVSARVGNKYLDVYNGVRENYDPSISMDDEIRDAPIRDKAAELGASTEDREAVFRRGRVRRPRDNMGREYDPFAPTAFRGRDHGVNTPDHRHSPDAVGVMGIYPPHDLKIEHQ